MSHTISAIIVNYNAGALLRNCVDSLLNSTLDIEIIVVDNASSDSSLDGLSALPQIRIIRNTRNLGFATACNIGVQRATAPYLLFVNPDCYFQPDTMATLLAELQSGARVGMVGGLLVNPDGAEQAGGRRAVPTPWRSFVRAVGLARLADRWPRLFFDFHMHKQPLPDHPIEVEAISGACMMVKCEAVADVGLLDEGYFLHCEDLDWCMRFRRKGWKVMFVPAARVAHVRGWSSRSRPIFVEWHKHKGMVRFYRKFFRHQYPGGLMGLVILGVWLRFGLVVAYHTARRVGGMSGVGSPVISTPPIPVSPVPVSPEPEFLVPMSLGPGPNVSSGKLGSVGVMGATSMVGSSLLPMLAEAGWRVTAFSRRAVGQRGDDVAWRQLPASGLPSSPTSPETSHATPLTAGGGIHSWICVLPIRVMPGYFALLESYGVRRVVVLSSTSRFTKHDSSDPKEQDLARRFVESEQCVQTWAESRGV